MTTKKKKTTPSRPRKKTVAKEAVAREDEAVAETSPGVVEDAPQAVAAEPPAQDDVLAVAPEDNGVCDNHADRPAVLVTNFRWTTTQRFCNVCIPPHYRHLL